MAVIRIPLLALTCLLLLGCSSSRTSSLQPAFQDYEAGHLSIARLEAKRVFERDDADKYEAAWVIGLCNQRLGSDSAALAAFETASKSPDPALSARARAMVGQCLVESGQPAVAAVHFEHAWPELKGEDRRQCARYAAQAWREAGREDRAELWASRLDDSGEAQHYIPAPVPIEGVMRVKGLHFKPGHSETKGGLAVPAMNLPCRQNGQELRLRSFDPAPTGTGQPSTLFTSVPSCPGMMPQGPAGTSRTWT